MEITRKKLDKYIKISVKKIMKNYGYKMKGSVLYKKSDDYFISILLVATGINNNLINARVSVKPYFFDDIFWEAFQMPENLKAPMSLRADGAFTVKGLQVYNQYKEINNYDEVTEYVEILLKECEMELGILFNKIGSDFKKFIDYSKTVANSGLYKSELANMLLSIKEEDFQEARRLAIYEINNQRYGNLENQGKDIYEHVIDFCEKKG